MDKNNAESIFGCVDELKKGEDIDTNAVASCLENLYRVGGEVDKLISRGEEKELLSRRLYLTHYKKKADFLGKTSIPIAGSILVTMAINVSEQIIDNTIKTALFDIILIWLLIIISKGMYSLSDSKIENLNELEIELIDEKMKKIILEDKFETNKI